MVSQRQNPCYSLTRAIPTNLFQRILQFRKVRETLHTSFWSISWYHPLISIPIDVESHSIERVDAICILRCAERKWWLRILGSLSELLDVFDELLDLGLGKLENPETSNGMEESTLALLLI